MRLKRLSAIIPSEVHTLGPARHRQVLNQAAVQAVYGCGHPDGKTRLTHRLRNHDVVDVTPTEPPARHAPRRLLGHAKCETVGVGCDLTLFASSFALPGSVVVSAVEAR